MLPNATQLSSLLLAALAALLLSTSPVAAQSEDGGPTPTGADGAGATAQDEAEGEAPPVDGEAVARAAHEALNVYCADVAASERTLQSSTVASVSAVWEQVTLAYEQTRAGYLLYWRGVLADCLQFDGLALDDLSSFLELEEGNDAFAGLLADARRRRRLLTRRGGAPAIRPPQAAGIALAISGAALGVVSGVRVTQFNDWTDAQLADPELRGTPTAFAEGYRSRAWANQVLIGSAISCGVGALVTLLAGSVQRRTPVAVSAGRAQLQVQVGTTVDPGLSVGLRGRW